MTYTASISRRTMIGGLSSTFLLVACGGGSGGTAATTDPTATGSGKTPVSQLAIGGAKEWTYAAGEIFTAGPYTLKLAGIDQLQFAGERPSNLRSDTFFAVFDILSGGPMNEGTLRITPSSSGPPFDIYMSASAAGQMRASALFN